MGGAWRTISVVLAANTAAYTAGLNKAAAETRGFAKEMETAGKTGGSAWSTFSVAVAAGAVSVALALGAAVLAAKPFDQAMRNVYSLGSESTPFAEMERQVLSLAREFPQSAATVADGLYDIESSGFSGAAALDILRASLVSASAGMTDTATAAQAITGVMNAYGPSVGNAAHVSDVLFQTVNDGVITFSDLAHSIGDFVPMAAALGISLEDVSAAMATITLAGVPANEAATSLNRVMMSFLQPTDQMTTAMGQLGISLSDLSNPAIGLHGVMERLRQAYGDNTVALVEMFGNVRATRGAMALFAQDGRTWNRVQQDMANSSGAAKRAFDEQMQGLSQQLGVLKSQAEVWAITIGTRLIPVVQQAGRAIGSGLLDVFHRLQPAWQDLVSAGHSLADVFEAVWHAAEPFVKLIGGLTLGSAIGALTLLASLLSSTAAFLEHNHALVVALTSALIALAAVRGVSALASGFSSLAAVLGGVVTQAAYMREAVEAVAATRGVSNLTAGVGVLRQSLSGTSLVAAGAFAAATAAIYEGITALQSYDRAAKRTKASFEDAHPGTSFKSLADGISDASRQMDRLSPKVTTQQGGWKEFGNAVLAVTQGLTPLPDTVGETKASFDQLQRSQEEYIAAQGTANQVVAAASVAYGMTRDSVDGLAQKLGIDWTKVSAADAFQQISDEVAKMGRETGTTSQSMQNLLGAMDPDAAEAFAQAMSDAGDAVAKTWASFFDITTSKATSIGGIQKWYDDQIAAASKFNAQVNDLISRGVNPELMSQLIAAGPAKAAPIVNALASSTGQNIVDMVNKYSGEIQNLSQVAIWSARIMAAATSGALPSDEIKNIPKAIQAMQMSLAGMKPIDIAAKLGLAPGQFDQMVKDFGLDIAQLQTDVAGQKVTVPIGIQSQQAQAELTRFLTTAEGKPISANLELEPYKLQQVEGAINAWASTQQAKVLVTADPAKFNQIIDELATKAGSQPAWMIKADGSNAKAVADDTAAYVESLHPELAVSANTARATDVVNFWAAQTSNREAVAKLSANSALAAAVTQQWEAWTRTREGQAILSANPSAAYAVYGGIVARVTGTPIAAPVTADPSGFYAVYAQMRAYAASHPAVMGPIVRGPSSRWGNVFPMAAGGVSSYASAGIGSGGPLYKWAEPETGGEAFIPRLGDSMRSKKILDIAASWYGMTVVPTSALRSPMAGGVNLNLSVNVDMRGSVNGSAAIGAAIAGQVKSELAASVPKLMTEMGRRKVAMS